MKSRYQQFEEFVFNKLWNEYNEIGKTFSVRLKASEGAERDYFIGKEKSGYLAFTYWHIPTPIRNPIDISNFFFALDETYYYFNFQFICQKNEDNHNLRICLQLGQIFLDTLNDLQSIYNIKVSKPKSKDFLIRIIEKKAYTDFESLWNDFTNFREIISKRFNDSIEQVKETNSDFIAEPISEAEFKEKLVKLEKRVGKNLFEPTKNNDKSKGLNMNSTYQPLNQILYGPPGTGKTYSSVALAYEIGTGAKVNSENYEIAKKWFKSELANEEDRQLDFITFHQNYSYEDFIMGIKPDLEAEGLGFYEHKGVFLNICQRALTNLKQSTKEGIITEPSFEEVFQEFLKPLEEENKPIRVSMKTPNKYFNITKINDTNLE